MLLLGLTTALVATACFGFGAVFQARGAREVPTTDRVRVGWLAGLARSWEFALGTALDIVGFGLSIVALRTLPLFLVQAVTNASLAVTAVAAVWLLGARLHRTDTVGITAVVAGLTLLAAGSGREGRDHAGPAFHWALLATTLLMLLLTALLARRKGTAAAAGLGLLAGVGFGVTSLAVRVLDVSAPWEVFADPAAYALAIGGLGGYVAYALALQRGTVTAATAAGTVSETFGPAFVGVWLLGDAARPGQGWAAVTGFAVAVGGTFLLSRFGEVEQRPPAAPAAGSAPTVGSAPAAGAGTVAEAAPLARPGPPCEGGLPDKTDGEPRKAGR
ncbi:hypothetical protein ACWGB8_37210 [Kitasatospora sp. NPDC054939]